MSTTTAAEDRRGGFHVGVFLTLLTALTLCGASGCSRRAAPPSATEPVTEKRQQPIAADDVPRIPAAEAHQQVQKGQALLICAYDNDKKFAKMALEGAIPRSKFTVERPRTPKNKQLIFF